MFILTTIEDLVQILPENTGKPAEEFITDAVNSKYANKIIQKIGMCICLFDILQVSQGFIGHGTGLVNINVEFRMLVFRPFRGEILYGRIRSSNEEGIQIDLDFHNEIFVPYQNLPTNSHFDQGENAWVWKHEGSELFFDRGEPVLFRVEQEEWIDQKPSIEQKDEQGEIIFTRGTAWRVIGSMSQSGLGPTLWWGEAGDGGGEEGDEEIVEDADEEDVQMEGTE